MSETVKSPIETTFKRMFMCVIAQGGGGGIDSSIVYDQPFQPEILGKRFSLFTNMYFHFIAGRTQVDVDGSIDW